MGINVASVMGFAAVLSLLTGCATSSSSVKGRMAAGDSARIAIQKIELGAAGGQTRAAWRAAAPAAVAAAVAAGGAPAPAPDTSLDNAYQQMMTYCSSTLTKFEQRSDNLTYWSVAIAVVGSLAGGVGVPALTAASASHKALVAALGGISGTANAGQQALSGGGITSASVLQSRENVLTNWKTDIADYYDSTKTLDQQRTAIEKSFADCELYEISTTTQGGSTTTK